MGDRLGIPGAVSFCFSFTGQLTHFLQASAFMRSSFTLLIWLLLLFAFWLLCDFFLPAFVWQKTAQPLRFFISPPGGDRQAFFGNYVGDVPSLDFKFKFPRIQRQKQILSSSFSDVGDWSKITCKWTNQIFSFFIVLFWYLGTGQEIHQLKKIQWNNHKGKSKYLFIYLFIFLGMAFLFFYIQN